MNYLNYKAYYQNSLNTMKFIVIFLVILLIERQLRLSRLEKTILFKNRNESFAIIPCDPKNKKVTLNNVPDENIKFIANGAVSQFSNIGPSTVESYYKAFSELMDDRIKEAFLKNAKKRAELIIATNVSQRLSSSELEIIFSKSEEGLVHITSHSKIDVYTGETLQGSKKEVLQIDMKIIRPILGINEVYYKFTKFNWLSPKDFLHNKELKK